MDVNQRILSDITVFMKYARYLPELNRRETWTELVDRNKNMHLRKFPQLQDEIEAAYAYVYAKKVLPSMRSLQFAGPPIEIGNQRMYNCCALPVDHYKAFSETLFLLLSGCFAHDTEILTKDGVKQIKDVKTDDYILTFDEKSNKFLWTQPSFSGVTNSSHKKKMEIQFEDGIVIKCTEDHQFLTKNRGWVEAKDLTDCDDIVHANISNLTGGVYETN